MSKGSGKNDVEKPTPRKRSRRKLTPFICQEMLYDYAMGRLDDDRKTAVDEYLEVDAECRNILEGIRKGIDYSEALGQIEIAPDVFAHLRAAENVISLGRRYSSWKAWDEKVRWSINAVVIILVTAGICSVIPWNHIKFARTKNVETVELAGLSHTTDQQLAAVEEQKEVDTAPLEQGSGDEEIEEGDDEGGIVAKAPAKHSVDLVPSLTVAPKAAPSIKPNKFGNATAVAASSASEKEDEAESKDPSAEGEIAASPLTGATLGVDKTSAMAATKEEKPKGFVMRAFMALPNLDELGPQIGENITELGGVKAGEVELGWKRGSGRYYHFSLPEENQEKLLEKLRAYGPVRISKDPHSRIMPQGQVRFILWVESSH